MADKYNPSAPEVIGQEWVPIVNRPYLIDSTSERGHSFVITSDVEVPQVSYGRYYLKNSGAGTYDQHTIGMTVYEKGDECATGPVHKLVVPASTATADGGSGGDFSCSNGGACGAALQSPSDGTYISFFKTAPGTTTVRLLVNFDVAPYVNILDNKRILDVSVLYQVSGTFDEFDPGQSGMQMWIEDNAATVISGRYASNIPSGGILFAVDQPVVQSISMGEVNNIWDVNYPSYLDNHVSLPWIYDDLVRFDDGASDEMRVTFEAFIPEVMTWMPQFGYVALQITYCEENRLLVGGVAQHGGGGTSAASAFASIGYVEGSNEVPLYRPQTRILGSPLTLDQEYTVTVCMMNAGEEQDIGSLPEIFATQHLYAMDALPGIYITRDTINGIEPSCEESDVLPQLSLVGNRTRATDNFNRTETSCWGIASDGISTYTCAGSTGTLQTDFTVNGTVGVHAVALANGWRESRMVPGGFGWFDYDITFQFRTPVEGAIDGGAIEPGNVTIHYDNTLGIYIIFRVSVDTNESIDIDIRFNNGTSGLRGTLDVFPASSWTANNFWSIRVRSQNNVYAMRVWDSGTDPEPPWWQYMAYDDTFRDSAVSVAGIRSGIATGNTDTKPVLFNYEGLTVVVPDIITTVHAYGANNALPVHDSVTVSQDIRELSDSTDAYPVIRFYARKHNDTDVALTVQDTATGLSTATITVAEFDALPEIADGWKEVNLRFDNPPLFDSAQGLVTFTWSAAGLSLHNQWQILAATAQATYLIEREKPYPDVLNPTYASLDGATWFQPYWDTVALREDPRTDVSVLFSRDAPSITGFSVSEEFIPLDGVGLNCGIPPSCIATGIGYNELTWLPVSSGPVTGISDDNFGYYEIQRQDDIDTEWTTIMQAPARAVTGFSDYEARIGMESRYRIRTCNSLDFCGLWSSTVSSTITAPGVQIGALNPHVLLFTSNEVQDGSSSLAYSPTWEGTVIEDFTFPEAETQSLQRMYGKNYFTAFRPLERGGEQFTRTLLVQAASVTPPTLERIADNIRNLAWADLPYVCVRTEDGDRWYANITIPSGSVQRQRKLQLVQVQISEVADTPSIVTLDG